MSRKPTPIGIIRHRVRRAPDPILQARCGYCNKGFWYRPSMGFLVHNGYQERLRVECGWCEKKNYIDPFIAPTT